MLVRFSKRIIFSCLMLLMVPVVCLAASIGTNQVPSDLTFNVKDPSCEKRGGILVHHPLISNRRSDNLNCNVEYKDGGKDCKSNVDCMGDCIKVPNIVEHGKCSPATLYNGLGIHYFSTEDPSDTCPHDEANGSCGLELFNKSDQWKDFHYVR